MTNRPGTGSWPDPFVVAICYPHVWWPDQAAFEASVEAMESLPHPDGGAVEVVLAPYEDSHERRAARGADPNADWHADQVAPEPATAAGFARMHAALALDLPVNVAELAPNLRWVQAFGAGSDQFGSCQLDRHDIVLTSSAGSNAVGIAEFALGRLIEFRKRFVEIRALQEATDWVPLYGAELAGTTLGLVGFGNIAQAIAQRARAFDMRVVATRRSAQPGDTDDRLDGLYPAAALHEMLGQCDAVISAVPNSPETQGLIDEAALAAMKPGAFFCNVGRGSLVDENALVSALESGHLGGAALDVASQEPLPPDHPIWTAPRLSLSFHNSAVPAAMFGNVHRLFTANLKRYLAGESLVSRVG